MKTVPEDSAFGYVCLGPNGNPWESPGLSKREWFAGMAMMGMHASTPGSVHEDISLFAVKAADRMIEELNKDTPVKIAKGDE